MNARNTLALLWLIFSSLGLQSQNLIACYPLDNGEVIDQVTGNTGAQARCDTVADRFGNARRALYFKCSRSSSGYLGNYPNLKPAQGTVSLWFKKPLRCANGLGAADPIINLHFYNQISSQDETSYTIGNSLSSGYSVRADVTNGYFINSPRPPAITLNTWYHIALVFDDTLAVLYQNGLEIGRTTKTATGYDNNRGVYIGYNPISRNISDIIIDDIRVYDAPMSATQAAALYASTANCGTLGINETAEEAANLRIIPNPNAGQFSVEQPEGLALVSYRLYDMAGRVLYSADGLSSISTLNFEGLANGTYLLELKDETGTAYRQKLLVTK